MFRFLEFFMERQGRPDTKVALDMEGRWPHIPSGFIKAGMIKDFGQLVKYLSNLEGLADDMLELLLDEDYGVEARYELLDSWFEELRVNKLIDVADGTDVYPASAVEDSLIAKILGKGNPALATSFSNLTDSLEAISDELHQTHQHVFILFVIPETSINADNAVLLAELQKLGHVHTITQADALDFPAFGMYSLAVCGTNSGTPWTTTNLADLKSYLGLPVICVDKVSAAYFKIGTDGGDAATKTTIDAISEIEGTVMGIGEDEHEVVTGLAAGLNTVSGSATYHTLNMADIDITEKVFACADNDPDGGTANQDVVMGSIPRVLDDGSLGVDEDGADVPASLGFLGFCYDASELTTLGKGAFYLFCHMIVATKILIASNAPNATIVDLRKRLLGNMKNLFTNTAPLAEYIAGQNSVGTKLPVGTSLYDIMLMGAGSLQMATTTESLNQIAGTYDLFTGTTQAVVLERLSVKMPTGDAGGAITSISIQTDDVAPGVIISSTDGTVANLTSESEIAYVGRILVNVDTKIQLTIAGGAHGGAYTVTIVAECRAIVQGGYLA